MTSLTTPPIPPVQATASPVVLHVTCASCDRQVELECRGLSGYLAYPAHYEYFCPHCHKQNHARTPGAIVAVRAA